MKRLFILGLFLTGLLFSCQKTSENNVVLDDQLKVETIATGTCFNFIYPIIVQFRDESTIRVHNDNELSRLREACANGGRCFDFVYPLGVTLRDGTTVRVQSSEQLRRIFNSCD